MTDLRITATDASTVITGAANIHRFEAGTPAIVEAVGLGAALEFMMGLGREAIAAHEADLTAYALERLRAMNSVRLIGTAKHKGGVIAFDTGPGNALIDEWMQERENKNLDDGGRTAARGRPDEQLLAWLLTHPFFFRRPPKSLDRNWFSHKLAGQLSTEDGAATRSAIPGR